MDYQTNGSPTGGFTREGQIALARPARFSVVRIQGVVDERCEMLAASDGVTVARVDHHSFFTYRKPLRWER